MKRWARVTLKVTGGLVLGVATLAAAWAAFNNRLADDAPRPVPEALRLPADTLPAERNAYYDLLGLNAGAVGGDPHAEGLSRWTRWANGTYDQPESPSPLKWPGEGRDEAARAWQCDAQTQDCVATWTREADGLRALVKAHADIGARCEAIARPGMAIEEPLVAPIADPKTRRDLYASRVFTPAFRPAMECLRWLQVRSALAAQAGDRAAMLGFVQQADALTVATLEGMRTLIGVTISGSMAQRHWRVVTDLAARDPKAVPALRAMLRPLTPRAVDPSRWIRTESTFGRTMLLELSCEDPDAAPATLTLDTPIRCRPPSFWSMPNATQHLYDEQWLQASALAAEGPLGLVDWTPRVASAMPLGLPRWRNTVGYVLAAVGTPGYAQYGRRQASVLLFNEAARLALAAGEVAPERRVAWLNAQPMDARLRERLSIADGHVVVRPWQPVDRQTELRYAIPSGVTSAGNVPGSRTDPSPLQS